MSSKTATLSTPPVTIRTAYDGLNRLYSDLHSIRFEDSSLTLQSAAEECDINNIIDRLNATGILEHANPRTPQYFDTTAAVDYHAAFNLAIEVQDNFDSLPSKIRDRFKNDPYALLAFLGEEDNREEAIKLGLIEASAPEPTHSAGADASLPPMGQNTPSPRGEE